MSIFFYKAKNNKEEMVEGMVDAASAELVANLLSEKNWTVINIVKKESSSGQNIITAFFQRIKIKDLVIFFRQLSVMIRANLPIIRALHILVKQTEDKNLKIIIANIANEVDGGAKLSSAMSNYPDVFSDFYSNVIKSGETSGRLGDVLEYLADQQEKDYDLRSKIKGAMIYPSFIVGGLVIVSFIVMTWVVPQITSLLVEAEVELPILTKFLISISSFTALFWPLIVVIVFLIIFGTNFLIRKTAPGRRIFDNFKIRMPIFGQIFKKVYIVRMFRSFTTLLNGGVPIAQALSIVTDVVSNAVYKDILNQAVKSVEEGNSISESFASHEEIPVMVSQMLSVGEETGRLDEVMERVTEFYSREIDASVANLSTLIEPVIMVILGIAIGLFVAAIILPMWQLSTAF